MRHEQYLPSKEIEFIVRWSDGTESGADIRDLKRHDKFAPYCEKHKISQALVAKQVALANQREKGLLVPVQLVAQVDELSPATVDKPSEATSTRRARKARLSGEVQEDNIEPITARLYIVGQKVWVGQYQGVIDELRNPRRGIWYYTVRFPGYETATSLYAETSLSMDTTGAARIGKPSRRLQQ